jgi:hypothetical protein
MILPSIFVDQNMIKEKSIEEIEKIISDLSGKLTFVSRMNNRNMMNQLLSTIESYKIVYQQKVDESMKKKNINAVIDIKK